LLVLLDFGGQKMSEGTAYTTGDTPEVTTDGTTGEAKETDPAPEEPKKEEAVESASPTSYMCRRTRNTFTGEKCNLCGLEPPKGTAAEESVSVELALRNDISAGEETYVLASVKTPSGEGVIREASNLVCVIDVSGSMGTEATIQGSGGTTESHGLSLLDVAKHGVRTILKTLGPTDRLAIVSFSTNARVAFPLTIMNKEGQGQAEVALDALVAMGGTNIWEGLKAGLDELSKEPAKGSFGHIMLLTDGESTQRETIMPNLTAYKETHERLPGTVSTFGFGYKLDSALLVDLAAFGSGSYSFIPDAGFVGTVFVNTMSNLLVTMAREVYLTLEAEDAEITDNKIMGGYPAQVVSGSIRVNLGTLQYGQTKDVVAPIKIKANSVVLGQIQYETAMGLKQEPACTEIKIDATNVKADLVEQQRCRSLFADTLRLAVKAAQEDIEAGAAMLQGAVTDVSSSFVKDNEVVQKLLEDMQGQCTEALSKDEWFKKWGRHYLPSVMFAHMLQQCNNFKDPGVQVYGGFLFKIIQEMADELFNELPAPKPSVRRYEPSSYSAPTSMAAFNDRYAG
jgi:hypothetical protein